MIDFTNLVLSNLNNREISILFWLLLVFLFLLFNSKTRKSFLDLLRTFFHIKIMLPFLAMFLYVVLIVKFWGNIGIWDISFLKDTIIWFIGTAIVLFVNSSAALYDKSFIKKTFLDNLKIIILFEFIVNFFVFNLFVEIVLMPFITFLVAMGVVAGMKEEYKAVKKIVDISLSALGLLLVLFSLVSIFKNFSDFFRIESFFSFILPPILTFSFIPFLFIFILIMKYELKIVDIFRRFYKSIKKVAKDILRKIWKLRKLLYAFPLILLITINQNLSTRSQLEFFFSGKAGGPIEEDGVLYYQYRHGGLIKNRSREKNTITNISLVVWADEKKENSLRDGWGPSWMVDNRTGDEIKLPLIIEGREAIDVDIFNKFTIMGTQDEMLLTATKPIASGSPFTIPKYEYQLTFTDINGNEFDEDGSLINRDVVNMNWTLENYCREDRYEFWPCNIEKMKIIDCKVMFKVKRVFHWLGMEDIGDAIYEVFTNFEK